MKWKSCGKNECDPNFPNYCFIIGPQIEKKLDDQTEDDLIRSEYRNLPQWPFPL